MRMLKHLCQSVSSIPLRPTPAFPAADTEMSKMVRTFVFSNTCDILDKMLPSSCVKFGIFGAMWHTLPPGCGIGLVRMTSYDNKFGFHQLSGEMTWEIIVHSQGLAHAHGSTQAWVWNPNETQEIGSWMRHSSNFIIFIMVQGFNGFYWLSDPSPLQTSMIFNVCSSSSASFGWERKWNLLCVGIPNGAVAWGAGLRTL